jgi:hypothetical protein
VPSLFTRRLQHSNLFLRPSYRRYSSHHFSVSLSADSPFKTGYRNYISIQISPISERALLFGRFFGLSPFPLPVRATWISVWNNGGMILTEESQLKSGLHSNSIPYLTENTFYIAKSRQLMFFFHRNHRCVWRYLNTVWGPRFWVLLLTVTTISSGN